MGANDEIPMNMNDTSANIPNTQLHVKEPLHITYIHTAHVNERIYVINVI